MALHGGRVLAEALLARGVEVVFGVPGAQTLGLYDGIQGLQPRLRHILMRDAGSAAYAADAYARLTGRVGVCDASAGPGAAKLPAGLGEAWNASIPILVIVSDLNRAMEAFRYRGAASQALEQAAVLSPLCKWIAGPHSAATLPDLVAAALTQATSGRPGPVVLTAPEDVFLEEAADPAILPEDLVAARYPRERPRPSPESVAEAARLLVKAARPFLLAGGGALLSGAGREVQVLAEALGMPVATTISGKGVVAESHPLAVGVLGILGTQAARVLAEEADVVCHVGCKSAENSTFCWKLPRPDQTLIHVDINPAEPGKVFHAAAALVGDAKACLADLSRRVQEILPEPRIRLDRRTRILEAKAQWDALILPELQDSHVPLRPQRVMAALQAAARPEDVLVCDAGFASGWGALYFRQEAVGRRCIFPHGLAGPGFALPAAVGARVASPRGQVFCLAGDGGFASCLGELATLTQHGLKVICLVLNNSGLAGIRHIQQRQFGGRYISSDFPDLDFARVAEGLGCRGTTVRRPDELKEALAEAVGGDETVVLDVKTEDWETPILADREPVKGAGSQDS